MNTDPLFLSKKLNTLIPHYSLNVLDGGSKGDGEVERWSRLPHLCTIYGFDPQNRPNSKSSLDPVHYHLLNSCLSDKVTADSDFYLTRQSYSHSLLPVNEAYVKRLKHFTSAQGIYSHWDNLALKEVRKVETTTIDALVRQQLILPPHFLKLDIQGAELKCLTGASKTLRNVLGLEVEVWFSQIYKDQPLFADIDIFLRSYGYTFFGFKGSRFGQSAGRTACKLSCFNLDGSLDQSGQLLTADALYLRDPIQGNIKLLDVQLLQLAIISELIGQIEYAFEILTYCKDNSLDEVLAKKVTHILDISYHEYTSLPKPLFLKARLRKLKAGSYVQFKKHRIV
jgi:FkbM family methyltransferase